MKNSSYTIGNQTHDLLACSTVPQPTAPPHAPSTCVVTQNSSFFSILQTGHTTTTTTTTTTSSGPGWCSWYMHLLWGWMVWGLNPTGERNFLFSVPVQTSPEAHLAYSTMGTRALSRR